jgi:hypothetical protein
MNGGGPLLSLFVEGAGTEIANAVFKAAGRHKREHGSEGAWTVDCLIWQNCSIPYILYSAKNVYNIRINDLVNEFTW